MDVVSATVKAFRNTVDNPALMKGPSAREALKDFLDLLATAHPVKECALYHYSTNPLRPPTPFPPAGEAIIPSAVSSHPNHLLDLMSVRLQMFRSWLFSCALGHRNARVKTPRNRQWTCLQWRVAITDEARWLQGCTKPTSFRGAGLHHHKIERVSCAAS